MAGCRRSPAAVFVSWLTAIALAIAPGLGALHRALVPHVVCEHGALVEVNAPSGADAETAKFAETAKVVEHAQGARFCSTAGAAGRSHIHCMLGELARMPGVNVDHCIDGIQPARQSATVCAVFVGIEPEKSVLLVAPKTSPPRRG